jgi:hypothetical protein
MTNDLALAVKLLEEFEPFSGKVPKGFIADFVGAQTDCSFRAHWTRSEGGIVNPRPDVTSGEGFFEAVSWIEAAKAAYGNYTMVTLGACYGGQAVSAYRTLLRLNAMPVRLVAVEADPQNFTWMLKHFRDNGLDPDQHWLINCAVSDNNKPVLFPVGASGTGINNCVSTNDIESRLIYAQELKTKPNLPEIIHNLIVDGDTGLDWIRYGFQTRIKFISAITLNEILAPLDRVDLLESDIQQSEIVIFPPAMKAIKAKVKRVHLGTHSDEIHAELLDEFVGHGFEIVFDYPPCTTHSTPWGSFTINDGVLMARNPG